MILFIFACGGGLTENNCARVRVRVHLLTVAMVTPRSVWSHTGRGLHLPRWRLKGFWWAKRLPFDSQATLPLSPLPWFQAPERTSWCWAGCSPATRRAAGTSLRRAGKSTSCSTEWAPTRPWRSTREAWRSTGAPSPPAGGRFFFLRPVGSNPAFLRTPERRRARRWRSPTRVRWRSRYGTCWAGSAPPAPTSGRGNWRSWAAGPPSSGSPSSSTPFTATTVKCFAWVREVKKKKDTTFSHLKLFYILFDVCFFFLFIPMWGHASVLRLQPPSPRFLSDNSLKLYIYIKLYMQLLWLIGIFRFDF